MVEEKARSLLPRSHFANLSYYINEYGAKGMTIDAFVVVLLEMLDTPEKVAFWLRVKHRFFGYLNFLFCSFQHSLVTEIRELVYPEDRTRYDELVYRRDIYSTDRDRHRVRYYSKNKGTGHRDEF